MQKKNSPFFEMKEFKFYSSSQLMENPRHAFSSFSNLWEEDLHEGIFLGQRLSWSAPFQRLTLHFLQASGRWERLTSSLNEAFLFSPMTLAPKQWCFGISCDVFYNCFLCLKYTSKQKGHLSYVRMLLGNFHNWIHFQKDILWKINTKINFLSKEYLFVFSPSLISFISRVVWPFNISGIFKKILVIHQKL